MARGSSQATTAATDATNLSSTYAGNAGALYSTLAPSLVSQAAHPQGIAPPDLAAADTAAQESAGGTQSAAVGQGALRAARTRNAGGADAAIAAGSRASGQDLAKAAVTTRLKNASVKDSQRSQALSGEQSLLGEQAGAGNASLGIVPQAVNANTNEENASWDWSKDLLQPILASGAGTKQFAI
jgi:hypothetical protein